jgi:hypothetical protein
MTTTDLGGFGSFTYSARVVDFVSGYLNEYADRFDVDGLVDAWRDAVNAKLAPHGISLHGDDFYGVYPATQGYGELIRDAIESTDLADLAPLFDLDSATKMTLSTPDHGIVESGPFSLGSLTAARAIEIMRTNTVAADGDRIIAGRTYSVELRDDDDRVIVAVQALAAA